MNVVLCWCCQNYLLIKDEPAGNEVGYCTIKESRVKYDDAVCCEFILRQGLHTKRSIPDYCKNYR